MDLLRTIAENEDSFDLLSRYRHGNMNANTLITKSCETSRKCNYRTVPLAFQIYHSLPLYTLCDRKSINTKKSMKNNGNLDSKMLERFNANETWK